MPGLMKLLIVGKKETYTGEVIEKQTGGYYQVRVGAQIWKVKSAVSETMAIGTRVVVIRTDEGTFIVGVENIKIRKRLEVVVDG